MFDVHGGSQEADSVQLCKRGLMQCPAYVRCSLSALLIPPCQLKSLDQIGLLSGVNTQWSRSMGYERVSHSVESSCSAGCLADRMLRTSATCIWLNKWHRVLCQSLNLASAVCSGQIGFLLCSKKSDAQSDPRVPKREPTSAQNTSYPPIRYCLLIIISSMHDSKSIHVFLSDLSHSQV